MFHGKKWTKVISLLYNKRCKRKKYKIESIVFLFEIALIGTILKNNMYFELLNLAYRYTVLKNVFAKTKSISRKKDAFRSKKMSVLCGKKCIYLTRLNSNNFKKIIQFHIIQYNSIQFATGIYNEFSHILDFTTLIIMTILLSSCELFS